MVLKRARVTATEVWASLRRVDAVLLISMLVLVSSLWAFVWLADEVKDHHSQRIDEQIIKSLRDPDDVSKPRGPAWLRGAMRDLTALGSAPVLVIFVLAVAGSLGVRHQYHALGLLLAATLGGRLLNAVLKALFARPRPDLAFHLTEVNSMSFPSGHAMDSAVIYLTMAALLARFVQGRVLKVYFVGLAAFLTVVIGISRVYLGVHYPSDVLAGWTAGLAWATVCWTLASYLQKRGSVEEAK